MKTIKLPLDTKSLYFNIKNDNLSGHTPTVATPLKKTEGIYKTEDILRLTNKEVDISAKDVLVSLLIKHSKTQVVIRHLYVFHKIAVNGMLIDNATSFGCYVKEETDESKVQYGRLKLHYPSKLIYDDDDLNINNREVYKIISKKLNNYAFIIQSMEYCFETDTLNFDALIVGERDIPYSKVFINEKGKGNKFNTIFNESAEDYDYEIIALRKKYGEDVNPYNYLDYFKEMKSDSIKKLEKYLKTNIEYITSKYPYSLFDFYYYENKEKKYGILRVTATKNFYFNMSLSQQIFMHENKDNCTIFLISDFFGSAKLTTYTYDDLRNMPKRINSFKYEEER